MITATAAWNRLRKLKAFATMQESDFRPIIYSQTFTLAPQATSPATPLNFPGGAVILGITACAFKNNVGIALQGSRNRQSFGLSFGYTNNESLTPGGPVVADALLGGGDNNLFPPRELLMAPNQAITCQAQNYTDEDIRVHVIYHCLIYRYAS